MDCPHTEYVMAGPRFPIKGGSLPTEICMTCLRWRVVGGNEWREDRLVQEIAKALIERGTL